MNTTNSSDIVAISASDPDCAPVQLPLDVLALVGGGEGTVTLY
jgi:hypothetical protein